MKNLSRVLLTSVLLCSLASIPAVSLAESNPSAGYHDYEALTNALKKLAAQDPRIVNLTSIGKTLQGKDLWMLQITGLKGPSLLEKQALLISGNLEGDHVIGSEVALGIAQYLVEQYGKDKNVTEVLDKRTFYIIPRLNPEGAEFFFAKPLGEHPGNLRPRDDDYDWLVDEDGPEDLNGDGLITMMRVKDKGGEWLIDEKDPRLMKKKEDGTPVDKLYKIYPEGIDNDGDGLYNEDGPGGFDIDRNFPHNFGYQPKGLGVYPASEIETQALIDFMTKYVPELKTQPHLNICGVLIFSKYDNLAAGAGIECGTPTFPQPPKSEGPPQMSMFSFGQMGEPGSQQPHATDPQPKKTDANDEYLFKSVSEKYKETTGIKSAFSEKPFGSMLEWAYFQFGVPSFSANLWSLREEEKQAPGAKSPPSVPEKPSGNDEKWLKWIDEKNNGQGFVAWTKYQHKQLGEVEIGGFQPYLRINPPADQLPALSKSHAEFALYLAAQFAEIVMDEPEIKKLSPELFEVRIKVHNRGKFPYATSMGLKTQNINSMMLRLRFEDDKKMKLFGGTKRYDLASLDGGAEKEFKWVIISPAEKKVDVTLWARNGGGTSTKTMVLK